MVPATTAPLFMPTPMSKVGPFCTDCLSSPYELNATWSELVRGESTGEDAMCRHLGSQAVMLAMRGIPGIYVHSLFASPNDVAAAERTGMARSVNRTRFVPLSDLDAMLADPASRAARALAGMRDMLRVRRTQPAFHPDADQQILDLPPGVIGIDRATPEAHARVIVNVSGHPVVVPTNGQIRFGLRAEVSGTDQARLGPWGMAWTTP